MIDIRDLTIGNWVFDGIYTKFPMQITSLSEGSVTMSFPSNEGMYWESEPKDLEGIPITEELLKKIGFSQMCELFYLKGIELTSTENGYIPSFNCCEYYIGEPIFYVHELQNLYRCLTRKELKIEL